MKDKIFDTIYAIDKSVAYGFSPTATLPYVRFSLVSHVGTRLSNARHNQRTIYQVDYFSRRGLDVSSDEHLIKLQDALESAGLITTEWQESIEVQESEGYAVFHYFLEVC